MDKVYFIRHQAHGVLWEMPFAEQPTDVQMGAVVQAMAAIHGLDHPKLEEPYWVKVVEVPLRDSKYVPAKPGPAAVKKGDNTAETKSTGPVASGTGTVKNP